MSLDDPQTLVGARRECPLIVGRGDGETFLASAIPAFLSQTRQRAVHRERRARRDHARRRDVHRAPTDDRADRAVEEITWDEETAEKGGYETFMLKEIHEQADALAETIFDRAALDDRVDLNDEGALDEAILAGIERITIVACGTSYHAGLIGSLRDRGVGADAGRDGDRVGVPLPPRRWPGRATS